MWRFKSKWLHTVLIAIALCSTAWLLIVVFNDNGVIHARGQIVFYLPPDSPQRYPDHRSWQSSPGHFELSRRQYLQPCPYIINIEDTCRGNSTQSNTTQDIDYLFLVSSAVPNFGHRKAIRDSWGRDVLAFGNNRLAFLLGSPNSTLLQSAVESESALYSDIIQGNFSDTYRNVTLKSAMMLHWTTKYCPGVRFLVKVDDDTYLNVPNLVEALRVQRTDAIYGMLYHLTSAIRSLESKWYVTVEEYPGDTYPDYVGGAAYVVGGRVVELLYNATGAVKPFSMEDAYITGTCAQRVGIPRVLLRGVSTLKLSSVCEHKNAIAGHYVTPSEMVFLWSTLQRTVLSCHYVIFNWYFCNCAAS
ncbi:beta-1,3-galactosyltransferase 5-like [Ornithodoros turicata]|uniref:beta-1,3-galactosyltransferase 5-like n=1 Tax=Ornithodoros turicata TaxID=34597 RepID=UPI0031392DFB